MESSSEAPSEMLVRCDCCLRYAEEHDLYEAGEDCICEYCQALFKAAELLSEKGDADEVEIISTLAFAAHCGWGVPQDHDWERTVDVNCKGAMNCIGAVLQGMLARGRGHIVTISSDAGRKVFPGLSVYSGSKFFVEALSQGLRLETAGTGIKVTTIQPGNVATDLLALSSDEEALKLYGQQSGARVLDPEDVAASVVYVLKQPDHVAVNEILVEPRDEPV